MSHRSSSQCFAISPLDLGSLDLRESEYFLPSPDQETSTLHHESFDGQVSASYPQQLENNEQSSAETEHDSDESLHLIALVQSTSGIQSSDDDVPGEVGDRWRPSFLTKTNLFAFIATLALLIAGLETIWGVSQKNSGLASAEASLQYLWTYGPSAILTLISAIWDCVEYEAKAITPWLRKPKVKAQPLEHLTLDYVSMNALVVPFRSLARRDFLVAICAVVSLSFKILIVLSSSLITLTYTTVTQTAILSTRFVDDPSRLSTSQVDPLVHVIGREVYGLQWPHGTSEEFVYQSIRLPLENVTGFHTMVEGLSFGLDCQIANASIIGPAPRSDPSAMDLNVTFNIDINSPDCDSHISYTLEGFRVWSLVKYETGFGILRAIQCTNYLPSRTEGRRLAWVFGAVGTTTSLAVSNTSAYTWTIPRLQSLLCIPSYNISDVTLAGQDKDLFQISLAEEPHNRSFDRVKAWDITNSILDAHNSKSRSSFISAIFSKSLWNTDLYSPIIRAELDDITAIIAGLNYATFRQPMASYNTGLLTSALQRYYSLYAAFLVYGTLLEPATDSTAGTVSFKQQRLIVQTATCQVMVGLCIGLVIGILAMSLMIPRVANFSGDPGTVIGMATLMVPDISRFPRGYGAMTHVNLKEALLSKWDSEFRVRQRKQQITETDHRISKLYRPTVLNYFSRGFMITVVGGILILLEALLRHSDTNGGIAKIGDQTYIHYLWTTLPALLLTLAGLYFSSVDSELRALSPLETLSRKATSGGASLKLSLLGRLYPHTVWKELQAHKLAAVFATTCSLVASLLTVTAGSLFFEVVQPSTFTADLNMTDRFSSDYLVYLDLTNAMRSDEYDSAILPSLLLGSNLSYPGNTYEGLVFPAILWPDRPNISKDQGVSSTFDIKAVLPALQSRLICRKYTQSDISASMIHTPQEALLVNITDESCDENPYGVAQPLPGAISGVVYLGDEAPKQGIFAMSEAAQSDNIFLDSKCLDFFVFVWGSFESDSVSVSAAICNMTFETVYADVLLVAHDLSINPTSKPSARQGTRQKAISEDPGPFVDIFSNSYSYLVQRKLDSTNMLQGHSLFLDNFFSLLTTSRNALPLNALANLDEEDTVIAAMSLQHSIIAAQRINSLGRLPLPSVNHMPGVPYDNDPGIFALREDNGTTNNTTIIEATVEDYANAHRRIVMNATATRVLEGLLAATLLLALLAWAFVPKTAISPHPATSIMGTMALLVDGDLVEKWQSPSGRWNVAVGDDEMFRLGWGPSGEGNKGEAGKRFGIWAVPKETQKALP